MYHRLHNLLTDLNSLDPGEHKLIEEMHATILIKYIQNYPSVRGKKSYDNGLQRACFVCGSTFDQ